MTPPISCNTKTTKNPHLSPQNQPKTPTHNHKPNPPSHPSKPNPSTNLTNCQKSNKKITKINQFINFLHSNLGHIITKIGIISWKIFYFSFINQSYPQNLQNKNVVKGKKEGIKKPLTVRSHSYVGIFDWMMEIAAIMKLNRQAFYRACNIFYEVSRKDPKVLQNSNVEKYACACILISAKLQKSNTDYLGELFFINKQRMSKQMMTMIQISIYQLLEWRLPLYNLVSEQVMEVMKKWNQFLQKCEKMSLIRKDTRERFSISREYSQSQPLKNKTYGEILYLLDMIVLNQPKKYMSGIRLNDIEQQKNKQLFITPIVISIYSVLTVQLGDTQNQQQFLLPLFKQFYREQLQMPATDIDRLSKQIQLSFMLFNFHQHLRKIPLTKDWKQLIENDTQTYLPIKVIKKNQIC